MLLDFAMLCFKLSSAHSMPLVFFLSSRVHHRRRQHHHHLVLGERDKCTFRFHEDESRSGSFVTHSFVSWNTDGSFCVQYSALCYCWLQK
jgi:hypothetical protein